MTYSALVVVASTRAAAAVYDDLTGPVIREWLLEHGFEVPDAVVVPDGPRVAAALDTAVESGTDLVVTTGGTGIAPGDGTVEATRALLTVELPGFGEELRRRGAAVSAHALLSRGTAGLAGRTAIVNLPGSTGGVRDGLQLLGELIDHLLDQRDGGTHA